VYNKHEVVFVADIQSQLIKKRDEILSIAAKHGAYNVKLFGSIVRGESTDMSDIDFLVDFEEGRSLFDLIAFKQDLEDMLGRKVDVVTNEALHWYIREQVMNEAVPL
jgi:predicted nucleotidyltransferase